MEQWWRIVQTSFPLTSWPEMVTRRAKVVLNEEHQARMGGREGVVLIKMVKQNLHMVWWCY
jgi:hypothetical protein